MSGFYQYTISNEEVKFKITKSEDVFQVFSHFSRMIFWFSHIFRGWRSGVTMKKGDVPEAHRRGSLRSSESVLTHD